MAAERILRSKVVEYSDINVQINRMRKDIVADLRARGHHAAAMEITRVAVIELQLLQEYIASLYPLEIETHGLYRALRSPALACLKSTQFEYYLRGTVAIFHLVFNWPHIVAHSVRSSFAAGK